MSIVPNLPAPNWPPRVVADLMTRKIITVGEDEPIGDLEDWMERFRFRHLPVVDSKAKLVGLISLVDFLHARLGTAPENTPAQKLDAQTPAAAIMRRNVVIARLDSPLRDACDVMLREKLACLPVVLDDGTLVGILTTTDLVRLTVALLPSQQ